MFPLSRDVIISGTQLISLDSHTHIFSHSFSLLLLLLSPFHFLPLFSIITMETMFTGRAVWDPLRRKKVHGKHTHHGQTCTHTLSGYYEHTLR